IRVTVTERVPAAIVRLAGGDVLIDEDANILASARYPEEHLPFILVGWDEAKTEKASKENLERLTMYRKMLGDWQQFNLASRIKLVNMTDLRDPRAVTVDSGQPVSIAVGRSDFAEQLKKGITAIVGKGQTFEAVNLVGQNMILAPRRASGAK
ncbi:MAG: hypothetical protein ABR535_03300, partial [Pyrinomonadaceae bacterium]